MAAKGWVALVTLVSLTGAARAQDVYALLGGDGQVAGTVTVERGKLRTELLSGEARPDLTQDAARSGPGKLVFVGRPATRGMNDVLGGGGGGGEITATLLARELVLERRRGQELLSRERLRRWGRAALIVNGEGAPFTGYARDVARFYAGRGVASEIVDADMSRAIQRLQLAGRSGGRFERVVFISHGGWDGPMIGPQPEQGSALFKQLAEALQAGTTSNAQVFVSACHAAGSNVYELADGRRKDRWSVGLARAARRTVAGPAGRTSTEYTVRHVQAVLEGSGTTAQEVWVASAAGIKQIKAGGTLAGARAVSDSPEFTTPSESGVTGWGGPVAATPRDDANWNEEWGSGWSANR